MLLSIGAFGTVSSHYILPALEPPTRAATASLSPTKTFAQAKPATISGTPVRITVPALSIDLPVKTGVYNQATDEWTLGYDSAYYAALTPPVNNGRGTTLIYGHDLPGIFAPLHNLQPGNELEIYTENGFKFRYKFQDAQQVTPENTRLLKNTDQPTVLLQTCSGLWSQYRTLFSFELISVEKV